MKSEKEIKKKFVFYTTANAIAGRGMTLWEAKIFRQGYIRALEWVLGDSE